VKEERALAAVTEQLRADAASAVQSGDEERVEELLDVTYDVEAWANTELRELRERLA